MQKGSVKNMMSMTGYGRISADFEDWSWVWEIRAVNGKNLKTNLRLPPGFESLETVIRKHIAQTISRGHLHISLTMLETGSESFYRINKDWLLELINSTFELGKGRGIRTAQLDGLYGVKGVVEEASIDFTAKKYKKHVAEIIKSLAVATDELNRSRRLEGQAMAKTLTEIINKLAERNIQARECANQQLVLISQKLTKQFQELLGDMVPEDKLVQEAASLAIKADIREEVDRIDAHIKQAKTLLGSGEPIGRKLDFLSQEFIREINTLCAKSARIELTNIGLEMKSLTEQFREQAANVE